MSDYERLLLGLRDIVREEVDKQLSSSYAILEEEDEEDLDEEDKVAAAKL